jgi:hypothetical protein
MIMFLMALGPLRHLLEKFFLGGGSCSEMLWDLPDGYWKLFCIMFRIAVEAF